MLKTVKATRGFTLVELLIVIVVIAILAAITIVAYNGVQSRAKDATIRQAASQFATALQRYAVQYGTPTGFGSGSTGSVSNGKCSGGSSAGWASAGLYACSVGDMLVDEDILQKSFFTNLPVTSNTYGGSGLYDFMLYPCGSAAGQFILYWTLDSPSGSDTQDFNDAGHACGQTSPTAGVTYTKYGMRSAKVLNLSQ